MRRIVVMVTCLALAAPVLVAVDGPAGAAACEKTWANPGTNGVWDQAGVPDGTETQWTPAGVPTATDTVCLPQGDYAVTVEAGDSVTHHAESLTVGDTGLGAQPTLWILAGTLETHADSTVDGTLALSENGPTKLDFVGAGLDLTVRGTLQVDEGTSVRFLSSLVQPSGLAMDDGTIQTDTYDLTGGALIGHGTIDLDATADTDLTNSGGTIDPGNTEVPDDKRFLNVIGNYTQTSGGTFHVDLDGQFNTVDQDHMHVTQVATLGGTLDVDMTEGPLAPADIMIGNGVFSPFTPGMSGLFAAIEGVPADWIHVNPGPAGVGFPERRLAVIAEPSFDDVPVSHAFFADIEWLALQEITGGFPDGGYHPTAAVTRQSMAAFLYRLAGAPAFTPPDTPTFNDVLATHPFFAEIEWLAAEGITGGFADGGYHPTASVTRQSMAAFLYRMAGEPGFIPPGTPSFDDVPTSSAFYTEIEWLAAMAITGGFPDGGYHPASPVTRQSMAAFIRRYVAAALPNGL